MNNNIKYYNFNITDPQMSWCNIDTPLPIDQELLVLNNSEFSEVYTFIPKSKVVHYFPIGTRASAAYPSNSKVEYLGFKYSVKGIEMANGSITPRGRDKLTLKYELATVALIEQALQKLDGEG